MEPYEEISNAESENITDIWLRMCEDCKGTQERVLKGILACASDSEIGKKNKFDKITTVDEFRKVMSISEYSDIEEMVNRIAETGAEDILYNGPTIFFTSTSGTTGKNKLIPESNVGQDAKNAVVRLRHAFMNKGFAIALSSSDKFPKMCMKKGVDPRIVGKDILSYAHFFPMASSFGSSVTPGGIEVGFASGRTMGASVSTKGIAYPEIIMGLESNEATTYLTMLFALRYDDIFTIAGNNAGRMLVRFQVAQECAEQMIEDLRTGTINDSLDLTTEERATLEAEMKPHPERADELQKLLDKGRDEFIPKNYWPYLVAAEFWLAGSVGVNVKRIRPYLGDNVCYFDIGYGASEAKMNVPIEPEVGYGPLATFSAFYEFIPVGSDEYLTADQLKDGEEYEIVITTYSGLYRYNMHDVVKVCGFTGNTPNIEFLNKSRETLNLAQEKIPAPILIETISKHIISKGNNVRQAQVWPDEENRCYQLFIEFESDCVDITVDELDELVKNTFQLYSLNRNFGSIEKLHVFIMKKGWQEALYKIKEESGTPISQIKMESLSKTRPDENWILKEVIQ